MEFRIGTYVSGGVQARRSSPGSSVRSSLRSMESRAFTYDDPEEARATMQARQPHNRFVTPEEIAAMAVYLASDEAGSAVGACMIVDGGITAR